MSEIKDQLICYLQSVINKRQSERKSTSAVSLAGSLSQHKPFRDWLINNFRSGADLKTALLSLIQLEVKFFRYDIDSGLISNHILLQSSDNPIPTPIVLKTKFLTDLETNQVIDSFDDNLYVFELILFIVIETMKKETTNMVISDLIKSIGQKCDKGFKCYKSMIGFKQKDIKEVKSELDLIYSEEVLLNQLIINHFKTFFTYNSLTKTLTINGSKDDLLDYLNKTGLILLKKCLFSHLYRFGRKYLHHLTEWLQREHKIAFDFLIGHNLSLDQMIGLYPDWFIVKDVESVTKLIDLTPKCLGEKRLLQFDLMYKYGIEIRGIDGIVAKVNQTFAVIESKIEFFVRKKKCQPSFKGFREFIKIYGFEEASDLMAFIHCGDRLYFDVKYIPRLDESPQKLFPYISDELWFVSRIYGIKHSANCFVSSIISQWIDNNGIWRQPPGSDANLSDGSD